MFKVSRIPHTALKRLFWTSIAVLYIQKAYTIKQVSGRSMQPTLNPEPCRQRDLVLFDRWSVRSVQRGDIVSLRSPVDPGKYLVKRVIAVAGDVVRTLPPYPLPEVEIPDGHIWVEGDESFRTLDSNTFGPVASMLVDARLVYILWPFNRFGPLKPLAVRDARAPPSASIQDTWKSELAAIGREKWRSTRVLRPKE
ncbi:hypothetical protein M0805_003698 [Coniferiporia weirii]|nr:hypothetical protein M0805_003698 [Coniferiporia weirii]